MPSLAILLSAVLVFIVRTNRQTNRQTDRITHRDADDRLTHVTTVDASNKKLETNNAYSQPASGDPADAGLMLAY